MEFFSWLYTKYRDKQCSWSSLLCRWTRSFLLLFSLFYLSLAEARIFFFFGTVQLLLGLGTPGLLSRAPDLSPRETERKPRVHEKDSELQKDSLCICHLSRTARGSTVYYSNFLMFVNTC